MNKYQALYQWFNSFGIPFYVDTNVPSENEITYPYGTYQNVMGGWLDEASITVRVYDRSDSESPINKLSDKIRDALFDGGHMILCDEGAMHVSMGSPFCQALSDSEDSTIKSRYINLNIEYLLTK